jgi:hypothetical protein
MLYPPDTFSLLRCFHLDHVDHIVVRIDLDDQPHMFAFMAFERIGIIDSVGFVVLVIGKLFAIFADRA